METYAESLSESHALEDAWTLWFQKQKDSGTVNAKSWLEGLTEVMTFSTVCSFENTEIRLIARSKNFGACTTT